MTCHYCQSANAEDDHRCRRCGRRLAGSASEAPPEHAARALQAVGANALAVATAEMTKPRLIPDLAPTATWNRSKPESRPEESAQQPSLFLEEASPKVIPFDRRQKRQEVPKASAETAEAVKPRPAQVKKAAIESAQTALDFLPPSPHGARMLKTTVEAAIYCDYRPATPVHRATAGLLDGLLIGVACALFFGVFHVFGGPVLWDKQAALLFAGAAVLISLFYGFVWMLADGETPGMRWADLKLVSFNGFPVDRKTRALRMVGCFLSFCSGMIGFFWALVDEESLTWHDHMSKTFPTVRDSGSPLIRQ